MIINQEKWDRYIQKNKDPYGKCCVDITRRIMEILDEEKEFEPHDMIIQAEKDIGESGITGFMAGVISLMVVQCHSQGEEWKKKWNKEYGDENRMGVINPALLIITEKTGEK
jgi:hypothetical protein